MNYDADSIKVLEGLEGVRKRPAMYIGSTNTYGLHHLVWEIVDNAVDEALNGFGNKISVTIHKDGSVTVADEGRGIPCGIQSQYNLPAIQVILTTLHSGGKFNNKVYRSSGGLHGVGSSVTNALSEFFDCVIYRDGKIYHIAFEKGGKLKTPLEVLGTSGKHGSVITFKPDKSIFSTVEFDYDRIANHLKDSAFLLKGVHFILVDERSNKKDEFHYENGIKDYINELGVGKNSIGEPIYFSGEEEDIKTEVVFQYFNDSYDENIKSYVNNVRTIDGGTHESGFRAGLTRAVNEYIDANNLNKSKVKLEGNDIREGIIAIISVQIGDPEFEGQTKTKLGSQIAMTAVSNLVYNKFTYYLNENKTFSNELVKKCLDSQRVRLATRKAKEEARSKKKNKESIILSDKLTPCSSKQYALNELFIVEGDSAGGTAKKGRDPKYQAILPLRGKPLNCNELTIDKVLANQEFATIINTVGAGYGKDFDISDSHYGKIIIMTDADTDGAHIQTLLLTFFYNFMKPLITEGRVFIAMPPLYRVAKKGKGKVEEYYCHDDKELEDAKKKVGTNYEVSRYKGLGEMSDKQLKFTTMDKEHRMLLQVDINDFNVVERKIDVLMGSDSKKRKEWLEEAVDFSEQDTFIEEMK